MDIFNNTCKGCIHNMGNIPGYDDIYCEYIEDHINNTRCEYYEHYQSYDRTKRTEGRMR